MQKSQGNQNKSCATEMKVRTNRFYIFGFRTVLSCGFERSENSISTPGPRRERIGYKRSHPIGRGQCACGFVVVMSRSWRIFSFIVFGRFFCRSGHK